MDKRSSFIARLFAICVVILALPPLASTAGIEEGKQAGRQSPERPLVVYVADFTLHVEDGANESPGPLQVRKRAHDRLLPQTRESRQDKARQVVDMLAQSIVQGLNERNFQAVRCSAGTRPPLHSWLLEGEFVEYDEGDRLKRTIIGFGSGAADMEVLMKVSEVTDSGLRRLFDSTVGGKKNRMPGAVLTKNPYVAGTKFVITKTAPDREVKKLGMRIATALADAIEGKTAAPRP
ncbi:MAG: DUF4410 domain-containing protein [Pseudomonadota bacterium]|nr:DUF4410 domain-containing protein [Pseudomonadota bacterium]